MARAAETYLMAIEPEGTEWKFTFGVWIAGPDVAPDQMWSGSVSCNLTGADTLATFEAKRAQAIRDAATSIGASIAANQVLLITFKAG